MHLVCGIWYSTSAACTQQEEAVARLAVQGGVLVGDPAVCFKVRASCICNITVARMNWTTYST
jgi:hypothetical protein